MYPWMKNVNWRKTGLKLGYEGYGRGQIGEGRRYIGVWWGYPGGVWKFLGNFL